MKELADVEFVGNEIGRSGREPSGPRAMGEVDGISDSHAMGISPALKEFTGPKKPTVVSPCRYSGTMGGLRRHGEAEPAVRRHPDSD